MNSWRKNLTVWILAFGVGTWPKKDTPRFSRPQSAASCNVGIVAPGANPPLKQWGIDQEPHVQSQENRTR